MASRSCLIARTLLGLFLLSSISEAYWYEDNNYYFHTCPQATSIVNKMVQRIVRRNKNMAGGLLRLHFHDCFVRGCDASILLNSRSGAAEKDARPNARSLRGYEEIDEIKAALEAECPGIVSCADITALAARDATVMVGGPSWDVALGRKDGFVSNQVEAEQKLPSPLMTFDELVENFAAVGFNQQEMVVLSGAHTIGRAQCGVILNRLYDFHGVSGLTDPSLDRKFAEKLKAICPQNDINADPTFLAMDKTKNKFDELYFKAVLENKGLFTSDAQLLASPVGKELVSRYSKRGTSFSKDFAAAMVKMSIMEWSSEGEVRRICSCVNH